MSIIERLRERARKHYLALTPRERALVRARLPENSEIYDQWERDEQEKPCPAEK